MAEFSDKCLPFQLGGKLNRRIMCLPFQLGGKLNRRIMVQIGLGIK
jgi:hypothetical protein